MPILKLARMGSCPLLLSRWATENINRFMRTYLNEIQNKIISNKGEHFPNPYRANLFMSRMGIVSFVNYLKIVDSMNVFFSLPKAVRSCWRLDERDEAEIKEIFYQAELGSKL